MTFQICCPQCGASCPVAEQDVGKAAICGNCGQPIVISDRPVAAASPQPAADPSPADLAAPAVPLDPIRARALTQPIRPPGRHRLGCLLVLLAAGVAVFVVWSLPRHSANPPGRHACSNNLKQIALALHNYHDAYGSLPPAYVEDEAGRPAHSWRVLILPFLGDPALGELYDEYRFDEPWDGPNNRRLWQRIPHVFRCPSIDYSRTGLTPYQVIVGERAVFDPGGTVSMDDIYDGTANTILVVEAASDPVMWTQPSDVEYRKYGSLPGQLWSSNHGDFGLHVVFADGHVEFLSRHIDSDQLRSMIERFDGVYHVH